MSAVLAYMARQVLGHDGTRSVGEFTLRPAQREAVRAAEHALRHYGGALIADVPGTGKTVLALSIAATYDDVLVIVPAAVREQWRLAAARAGLQLRIETLEGLSQGRRSQGAPLIIVDEAHHLRNPSTRRYRMLAELAMHRHLLLLSATPVVNSLRDCDALLALFLGASAHTLSDRTRAAVILRLASARRSSTHQQHIAALEGAADVPGLAEALEQLPPPFPLADGASADAIIRLTLAFAWASSLAALDAALKRRMERGRALDDQLAAGTWPTRDALRAWVLGDDATQLALSFASTDTTQAPSGARALLAEHLRAVEALRERIAPHVARDTAHRAAALRHLLRDVAPRRVVLLAQSAVTVRALYAALRRDAGVVAITGHRVLAAAGRWTRDEILAGLGPSAPPYDPRDPRGIRLLIATDILAEGVELQGASVLVHGDPTWTPARREQRVGRLAREGQRHQVLVTQYVIPAAAERLLQLAERLEFKSTARVLALRPARAQAALRQRLQGWTARLRESAGPRDADLPDADLRDDDLRDANPRDARPRRGQSIRERVEAVRAPTTGFVALLRDNGDTRLIAAQYRNHRWRVRNSAAALLSLLPSADTAQSLVAAPVTAEQLRCVRRVLRRWHRQRRAAALLAGDGSLDARGSLPERLLQGLRQRMEQDIARMPLGQRATAAHAMTALLEDAATVRGPAAEQQLHQLLKATIPTDAFMEQLHDLCKRRPNPKAGTGRLSIEALLLLVGPAPVAERSGPTLP